MTKCPQVIEIVGPPGSGKSTLAARCYDDAASVIAGERLRVRYGPHLPIFARGAIALVPTLYRGSRTGRRFTAEELKKMVVLDGWSGVIRRQAARTGRNIVLDQGPVFRLATLHGFGPPRLRARSFGSWWTNMFDQWAKTLTVVVCLDADDDVLLQRIRDRGKQHAVKQSDFQEALKFLATFRASLDFVLGELQTRGRLAVLEFNTTEQSQDMIAAEAVQAMAPSPFTERTLAIPAAP